MTILSCPSVSNGSGMLGGRIERVTHCFCAYFVLFVTTGSRYSVGKTRLMMCATFIGINILTRYLWSPETLSHKAVGASELGAMPDSCRNSEGDETTLTQTEVRVCHNSARVLPGTELLT